MTARRIAILIDGGFFLKRLPKLVASDQCTSAQGIATCIRRLCASHINQLTGDNDKRWQRHVYRTFFYDAVPYEGKAHHPIDNHAIDFAKSDVARSRHELFDVLRRQRKLALRLGKVTKEHDWTIKPALTKKLLHTRQWIGALDRLAGQAEDTPESTTSLELSPEEARSLLNLRELWHSLDGGTVSLGLRQKGVDMRIGLDITTLTLKRQVDTIILVAGDSDFVPAAKLARREGIEFILDPLWQKVNADLFEHIDGLQSGLRKPGAPANDNTQSRTERDQAQLQAPDEED
ncbi:NYN domain-containing protein [Halomonas sp.]|uniref:NYN domain-containing protein n=1 Tax=Halomonas sp. TaxID=1486246 RepID=UPI0035634FA8